MTSDRMSGSTHAVHRDVQEVTTMTTDPNSDSTAGPSPDHGADQTAGPQQNAEPSPDVQTIDPRFRSP